MRRERGRPSAPGLGAQRMQSIAAVAPEALAQSVEERARDTELAASGADIARLLGAAEGKRALSVYLVFGGYRAPPDLVWKQERRRKARLAILSREPEMSRPFGLSSL